MSAKPKKDNKPIIETIINTCALTLTSTGTTSIITQRDYFGFVMIVFGGALEFFKYWGRKKKYW